MEKQVNSNTAIEHKFNKTTVFLTKFIFGDNFDMMKKIGFIDTYISDPEIDKMFNIDGDQKIFDKNQRVLFLLFKNKKLPAKDIKKIVTDLALVPIYIYFSYELINDYSMIVIDFPEKYIPDYDHFINGMYSKFSQSFKDKFPVARDVFNAKNIKIGKEYTLYHHVFNKTEWLKNFWMERLGLMELDEKLELWEKADNKDLIFDVSKII